MRKSDVEVKEVICSETGKPMPKIPMWMADIKVKFVCDEARQKNPMPTALVDIEPRKSVGGVGDLDEIKETDALGVIDEPDADFEDEEPEDLSEDEDFEA